MKRRELATTKNDSPKYNSTFLEIVPFSKTGCVKNRVAYLLLMVWGVALQFFGSERVTLA